VSTSRRPRRSVSSKAKCAASLCETLSLRRGLRPDHAGKECVGTWETSFGPGRGGDAGPLREVEETKPLRNRRGVGWAHTTCEALEQSRGERRRRAWREGAQRKGRLATMQAPDSALDTVCHRRRRPADRNYIGLRALKADHARSSARARCGKAARRDLCGGRAAMGVPTATMRYLTPAELGRRRSFNPAKIQRPSPRRTSTGTRSGSRLRRWRFPWRLR